MTVEECSNLKDLDICEFVECYFDIKLLDAQKRHLRKMSESSSVIPLCSMSKINSINPVGLIPYIQKLID